MKREEKGGRTLSFRALSLPSDLMTLQRGRLPFPSPPPLLPQPPDIRSNKTSTYLVFLRNVTTWLWQSWKRGDKTNVSRRRMDAKSPRPLSLFDLPFLHLAFQHWWSINRLWPLLPQLSFVSMCVLVWGGGCVTAILNCDLNQHWFLGYLFFFFFLFLVHFWTLFHLNKHGRKTVKAPTAGKWL